VTPVVIDSTEKPVQEKKDEALSPPHTPNNLVSKVEEEKAPLILAPSVQKKEVELQNTDSWTVDSTALDSSKPATQVKDETWLHFQEKVEKIQQREREQGEKEKHDKIERDLERKRQEEQRLIEQKKPRRK